MYRKHNYIQHEVFAYSHELWPVLFVLVARFAEEEHSQTLLLLKLFFPVNSRNICNVNNHIHILLSKIHSGRNLPVKYTNKLILVDYYNIISVINCSLYPLCIFTTVNNCEPLCISYPWIWPNINQWVSWSGAHHCCFNHSVSMRLADHPWRLSVIGWTSS